MAEECPPNMDAAIAFDSVARYFEDVDAAGKGHEFDPNHRFVS